MDLAHNRKSRRKTPTPAITSDRPQGISLLPDLRTPGVPNHASGPDFMRLFLGSEGTFGVITEATMRIARLP